MRGVKYGFLAGAIIMGFSIIYGFAAGDLG